MPLDPVLEQRLRDDLLDLVVIGSNLRVRLETDPSQIDEAHRAGLELLDEAEALLGSSHVLYRARQAHAAALGISDLARAAARRAEDVPPRSAWEHDAAGRLLLGAGDLARAEAAFERAIESPAPGPVAELPPGLVLLPTGPLPGCPHGLQHLRRSGPR